MELNIYQRLARHLAALGMGYPEKEELIEILHECFSPTEAAVALAIPTQVIPLEPVPVSTIARHIDMPVNDLSKLLSLMAHRGMLYSKRLPGGEVCYALQQFGYGFPQTFFWKGAADTPFVRKMAELIVKYSKKEQLRQAYGSAPTKPLRFVPASSALDLDEHAVFPFEMMDELIEKVQVIALAHCPCRVTADLIGKRRCDHPLEVCLKYDDLAEYVIERGMAREINRREAREILKACEQAGLVHLVDNAREGIKHTCNCCSCCCWSVGSIRRRAIQRDLLMATYFLRQTDEKLCTGCGQCVDACPVNALLMKDGLPVTDEEWCIGCGLCAVPCTSAAVVLSRRPGALPPADFKELHEKILKEKMG